MAKEVLAILAPIGSVVVPFVVYMQSQKGTTMETTGTVYLSLSLSLNPKPADPRLVLRRKGHCTLKKKP